MQFFTSCLAEDIFNSGLVFNFGRDLIASLILYSGWNSNVWTCRKIFNWRFLGTNILTWKLWFAEQQQSFHEIRFYERSQWISDLSEQSANHLSVWVLKVVMQVHPISTLPWSTPKPKNCPVHPPSPLPPTNFALKGLVSCRTRLCCVRGGNASSLSIEQLFDDGPSWASLWFQSLQRADLRMGLAYHYSHKWHGSGLQGSHILADNSVRTPCLKKGCWR